MSDDEMPTPDPPPMPDIHFGTDDQMLAWCESEGFVPRKENDGSWNWQFAWDQYMRRQEP